MKKSKVTTTTVKTVVELTIDEIEAILRKELDLSADAQFDWDARLNWVNGCTVESVTTTEDQS